MKKLVLLMAVLLLAMPAFAAEDDAAKIVESDCAQDVRPAVETVFKDGKAQGKTLDEMVSEAIELGPNLCGVLVVAEDEGYGQEAVLMALQIARIDNNVIARAAMDAGYDQGVVARVVGQEELSGLGYTAAGTPGAAVSGAPGTVGGGGRGTSVSPATVQ